MRRFFERQEKAPETQAEISLSFQEVHSILSGEAAEISLSTQLHESTMAPDHLAPTEERERYLEEISRLHGRQYELHRIGIKLVELYKQKQDSI